MLLKNIKRYIILVSTVYFLFNNSLVSFEYDDIIGRVFADRKLDLIEGIWKKTYANSGSTGCITMFYKDKDNIYYQIHIDSCFVVGKITGKHNKLNQKTYSGENAVYFFDRSTNWAPSIININDDLNSFSIKHGSNSNTFIEKWERIWPKNFENYNK